MSSQSEFEVRWISADKRLMTLIFDNEDEAIEQINWVGFYLGRDAIMVRI